MPTNDVYTAPVGARFYVGKPAPLLVALYGDSLQTHRLGYNLSPSIIANGILGGGRKIIANLGVAGNTVGQMLARVHNLHTAGNPGFGGLPRLAEIDFRGGTNDGRYYALNGSVQSAYEALLNAFLNYGDTVTVRAVPPLGGPEAAANANIAAYNAFQQALCATNPRWRWIDDCSGLRDGSGSQIASMFNIDGVHTGPSGVYTQGVTTASLDAARVAALGIPSPLITNPAMVYPAAAQWCKNPTNAGTGGTAGSGFTGTVANHFSIGAAGAGNTGICYLEAAQAGDPNQMPWQFIEPTQVSRTGAGESIRITTQLAGRPFTDIDPASLDMVVEVRLDAMDSAYINLARMWVQGNTGHVVTENLDLRMGGGPLTNTIVLRLCMPRPTAVAQTTLTVYWDWVIAANRTGPMGRFGYRCLSLGG